MDEWPRSQPVPLWQRLLYAMVDLSPELADTPAIEFQSEEQFQQLLDRGPVMTALMVPGCGLRCGTRIACIFFLYAHLFALLTQLGLRAGIRTVASCGERSHWQHASSLTTLSL